VGVQAGRRVPLEQPGEHRLEPAGERERDRLPGHDRRHGRERVAGVVGRPALDGGEQGGAERPQVGGRGRSEAAGPLGRDVGRRAQQLSGAGERGVAGGAGDAEVGQHHPAVGAQQHVGRLDVAVDDALRVRGVQRREHRQADLGHPPRRQRAGAAHHLRERLCLDQLHHQERLAVLLDDVVDGHGVGGVEPGRVPGLPAGALPQLLALGLGQAGREQHLLDRHLAVQELVLRAPDGAHAPRAEGAEQPVALGDEPVHAYLLPNPLGPLRSLRDAGIRQGAAR
jgi:hypothetical protein